MRFCLVLSFITLAGCRCVSLPEWVEPEADGTCAPGFEACAGACRLTGRCDGGSSIPDSGPIEPSCDSACEGCCEMGRCVRAEGVERCGAAGLRCISCGTGADICTAGSCRCGGGAPCAQGQRCSQGQCVCDATSCAEGCCASNGRCVSGVAQNDAVCGSAGASCTQCGTPPVPRCSADGQVRTVFRNPGACRDRSCSYEPVDVRCTRGCDGGNCIGDGCQGCLTPPPATCVGSTRRSYASQGMCTGMLCDYQAIDTPCPDGCENGACLPSACLGVTCTQPPPPDCADATTRRLYREPGACTQGRCDFAQQLETCNRPPASTCMGNQRLSFDPAGNCSAGACSYRPVMETCANGCSGGTCIGDPCSGVSCTTPPAPDCADGTTRRTYNATGTCTGGMCGYGAQPQPCSPPPASCVNASTRRTFSGGTCTSGMCTFMSSDTACMFGCAGGACNPDPCAGVTCNSPPPRDCLNGTTVRSYTSPGSCSGGQCSYTNIQQTACNQPPPATCSGTSRTSYAASGTCTNGQCNYQATTETCTFGCAGTACAGDPCAGVSCNTPPVADCFDSTTRRVFNNTGSCLGGMCSYGSQQLACNTPPGATCANSTTRRTFSSSGSCTNGVCNYMPTDTTCTFGCTNGVCNADPCAGVSCNSPPAPACLSGTTTLRTYSATGTCNNGSCTYGSFTDTACVNGCSNGACVACVGGGSCIGNGGAPCRIGVLACPGGANSAAVCVDGANAPDRTTTCTNGRCLAGACCTGCIQGTTTPSCAGGFVVSACGIEGANCASCPGCPPGRTRLCDNGACVCEF
jgi:hypothetical protein